MAEQKFLVHVNLQKNQLLNAVVQPLSSSPSSPSVGQIYYDTTLNQFGVYQNNAWVYLAAGGTDTEAVQDIVAGLLSPGSVVTGSYNDAANTLTLGIGSGVITNTMVSGTAAISADKLADGSTNVVMLATERTKLQGVAAGATNYSDTNARANRLDQFAAPTAAVSFNSQNITNLADPTAAQHGATKNYVDTQITSANTSNRSRVNHTGTQAASTISDFDTQVRTSRLDQLAAPTAAVSLNSQRVTSLADPTGPTDAVTKQYADGLAAGFDPKGSVRAATTGTVTLSNGLVAGTVIDGYTLATGDRVLVKNQATASENGIYVAPASGPASRSSDANTSALVSTGMMAYVEQGTVNSGQVWILTTTGAITLGTTGLTFTQFSGASTLTAGAGLSPSGNVFNVGQGNGIIVNADTIQVDPAVVTRKFAQTVGDGSTTAIVVTHNLNTLDVEVSLRDTSTNEVGVGVQAVATSVNQVTLTFNVAPATGAYRAIILG